MKMYVVAMLSMFLFPLPQSSGFYDEKTQPNSSSCVCKYQEDSGGMELTCSDCLSVTDLNDEIQRLAGTFTVSTMHINNAILMYLPLSIFKLIKMEHLKISNSTVMGLENDRTSMLQLSRDRFKIFELEYVTGVDSWRWSAFSDLGLETLRVQNCDMYSVEEDFGKISPGTLRNVVLVGSKIEFLEDHAFRRFTKLYSMFLYKNNVRKLTRELFPTPANDLRILDFGDNKLESLPADIFSNMPALIFINLENNILSVLYADTFQGLMSREKLHLNLEGNKIYCCSNIQWILSAQRSANILGTCDRPARLSGRDLKDLRREDLETGDC